MPRLLQVSLLLFLSACSSLAQGDAKKPPTTNEGKSINRLQTLMPALETAEQELDTLEGKLANAVTEGEKAEIAPDVAAQRERVAQLRSNFLTIATGVEESRYTGLEEDAGSWEQNLEDIIAPISRGVRQITADAREMEQLNDSYKRWKDKLDLATTATRRLDSLLRVAESPTIRGKLEEARRTWRNRLAEAISQTEVLEQTIEERKAAHPSTWEAVSQFFAEFWRTRGLNLLIAAALAVVVFMITRRSYRLVRRLSPLHRKGGQNLAARILDLAWAGVAGLLALGAVVLVLYLRGDWLLLALAILATLGILWSSKQALLPYLEQIRLILNLGPVRQGERLVFNGIPWRVDRLHFYCEFRNPALANAVLRLPVRDVLPLYSRPTPPKEQWFPTQPDDWVRLADGTYGKVIQQSPEQVVVLRLGGSLKTYPTSEFLAQTPENLSRGFRINTTFGIDYCHQEISTSKVPVILQHAIELALLERVGREGLRSLKVEFASAATSSLDYAVLADFDGEVASRLNLLERLIHKTCVDVCNKHGWVIPFTQVTIHQAGAPAEVPTDGPAEVPTEEPAGES